jgi:glycerol-3-phosphate dehydrogenase
MSLAPGLKSSGLRGGIVYNDCIMLNSDRLTLSFLQSAQKAGAVVANYVEATGCNCNEHHSQKKIESVTCLDKISGEQFEIKAKIVINATGPWARNVADKLLTIDSKRTTTNVFSKGIQVVLPPLNNETKLKHESAILVDSFHVDPAAKISRGVRSYFFVPWQGVTLAGTYDRVFKGDPDNFKITEEEVASFLEEIGQNYTAEELKLENVRYVFGGLRPIAKNYTLGSADAVGDNSVQVSNKDEIIDHLEPNDANWPKVDNLFSVIGVKYTTCRLLAEKVVDLISTKRSLEVNKSSTSRTVLIGGESTDVKKLVRKFSEIITEISPKLFLSLEDDYGSEIEKILELISEDKTLVQELVPGSKVIKAQVVHAARNEFAKNLSDVVFRRTSLATKGYPGEQALTSAAEILAKEFNWTSQKIKEEVQSVTNSHYFKLSH